MPRLFARCLVMFLLAGAAEAQPLTDPAPASLREWRPWVLKDLEYRACPFLAGSAPNSPNDFICAWPGRLALTSTAEGADFAIHWRVEAPSWVALPGDDEHWPQQVTINGQHQPVLSHLQQPMLWLIPGSYEIGGRIPWRERPQSLSIPSSIGVVALSVDGKAVAPVQRDGNQITLGRAAAAAPEADNLSLRVFRKLADGVPATLSTQIAIGAAGQAREEIIGPVLPEGFAPLALDSPWPARLDGDGRLHVQVRPGNETLTLEARATAPLVAAAARIADAPWPKQEIWSYEGAPRLRVTVATSPVQVDPRQADVPGAWQNLPAFALAEGGVLTIEQRSRGLAADEANRLSLQREAWLDFSGAAWYARDHVAGSMAQGWRFDVAAPYALEQATAQNSGRGGEPLLITQGASPELTGVEWRLPRVDLAAGMRVAAPATMPVAGWQQTFDSVQATLHFPFGYKLLAAPGADGSAGSWAAAWTLLDAFVCAIIALLAWRLFGLAGAVVVGAFLLLAYQENGSPLWTIMAALGITLIARALPAGRLAKVVQGLRYASLAALVLVALPFFADQVRFALYPQLEQGGYVAAELAGDLGALGGRQNAPMPARMKAAADAPAQEADALQSQALESPAPMSAPPPAPAPEPQGALAVPKSHPAPMLPQKTAVATASIINRADLIEHYSQNTIVQTGTGAASWNLGSTAWLSWSGPVLASQNVHLLIAPPWLVRLLRLVLAGLLAWILGRLLHSALLPMVRRAGLAGAAAMLFCLIGLAPDAQAQGFPSNDLLQQLRQRSIEAPRCAPACATIAQAQIVANGDSIAITLEAHAGERVALPLPYDPAAIVKAVLVDGIADEALARDAEGHLWLALGRGVRRIQLELQTPDDKLALAFPLKPARILFQGKGWEASGIGEDRLLTETLTLARARENAGSAPAAGVQQFPPYVRVQRHLTLGLEWSASSQALRLSPAQGGFTVEVPLLAGEHVSTSGVKVQNGKAQVSIADNQEQSDWSSTLDKSDTLTLTAPALGDRAEVWSVLVSPTWHVDFSGVPDMVPGSADANDFRNFEFHPLPGETLTLRVSRPAAAQGASRAIDAVSLMDEPGQRASTQALSFSLRSSQGGEQAVSVPADAEVLSVSKDGVALNLRARDGSLSLPVTPGTQRYDLRFRRVEALGIVTRAAAVDLGMPAANISVSLRLPADRWLLATWGPTVGPAVLYWGELIVMIALAYALARTRRTRLGFRDWLLLGLGFSTFSWVALLVVVAWLFAFDWRARGQVPASARWFNLLQATLVLLTVIAILCLVSAIPQGLLGQPDMHVTGNGSDAYLLRWFADRSAGALPAVTAVSMPLWVYKVLMLAWSLWLANALIGWLRAGFAAWTQGGYWRGKPAPTIVPDAAGFAAAGAGEGLAGSGPATV